MSDNLKEREAFEAWATDRAWPTAHDGLLYEHGLVQTMWAGWKARAAIEADRVSRDVPAGWSDAYAAFKGAFDTPLARRNDDSEFANDARARLRNFNEAMLAASTQPQPVQANVHEQVVRALAGLLEQVEVFVSKHGEADFETAEALRAVEAAVALESSAQPVQAQPSEAAADVLAERQRQISVEGWTPEHDDEHREGSLARAGGLYALNAGTAMFFGTDDTSICETPPDAWPWKPEWWKPKTARRDLVKAGALILAEIERLDRAEQAQKEE